MGEFERLLEAEHASVERFVRFRMRSKADADDVLQEIFLTAYQKFPQTSPLRTRNISFGSPVILGISPG